MKQFRNTFNQYKKEIGMKRYISLLLLVTSAVRCDVTMEDFAADVEQTYKKAKKRDEHCDRVAQVINNVVTDERCKDLVNVLESGDNQQIQKSFGTILDDIRAKLLREDKQKVGKIIKRVEAICDLSSRPDAESERVAMQVRAKLIVLNRLVDPYIKACEKHVDNKKAEQIKQIGQEITHQFFSDWKTFCAEQQKRFAEK